MGGLPSEWPDAMVWRSRLFQWHSTSDADGKWIVPYQSRGCKDGNALRRQFHRLGLLVSRSTDDPCNGSGLLRYCAYRIWRDPIRWSWDVVDKGDSPPRGRRGKVPLTVSEVEPSVRRRFFFPARPVFSLKRR